jgi:hypothetical protein
MKKRRRKSYRKLEKERMDKFKSIQDNIISKTGDILNKIKELDTKLFYDENPNGTRDELEEYLYKNHNNKNEVGFGFSIKNNNSESNKEYFITFTYSGSNIKDFQINIVDGDYRLLYFYIFDINSFKNNIIIDHYCNFIYKIDHIKYEYIKDMSDIIDYICKNKIVDNKKIIDLHYYLSNNKIRKYCYDIDLDNYPRHLTLYIEEYSYKYDLIPKEEKYYE